MQKSQNSLFLAAVLFAASGVPKPEWTWRPNCHSLHSRQFYDWKHPVGKAGCWGQFALLLFWLDLLVTGEKPSAGQQLPAHPFSIFPQKYIPFSWTKTLSDFTAYHQEEITTYILERQYRAPKKFPWFMSLQMAALCKVLPVLNSCFVIFLLSSMQSLTTSESSKMQVHHSTNVQSPENASSPNY